MNDRDRGRELLIRLYQAGLRDRKCEAGEVDLCRTGVDNVDSLVAADVRRHGFPRLMRAQGTTNCCAFDG